MNIIYLILYKYHHYLAIWFRKQLKQLEICEVYWASKMWNCIIDDPNKEYEGYTTKNTIKIIGKQNIFNRCYQYKSFIGKKVSKSKPTKEPKPFKSGNKINTVKGIIIHPQLFIPAFTFEEDDSYVECRRCFLI